MYTSLEKNTPYDSITIAIYFLAKMVLLAWYAPKELLPQIQPSIP